MANERVKTLRNVGTEESPVWEPYYGKTVADAVYMDETEAQNVKQYVDKKVADLVGSAPEKLDTLEELAAAMEENDTAMDALTAAIGKKVDKEDGKGLSTNDYDNVEKEKVTTANQHASSAHAPSDAEKNVIVTVKVNGEAQTPDGQRAVDIDVPTTVAELTDAGDYAKATDIPKKVSDLSDGAQYAKKTEIPTTVAELTDAANYAKASDVPTISFGTTPPTKAAPNSLFFQIQA